MIALGSTLVWANKEGSGETEWMCLAWIFVDGSLHMRLTIYLLGTLMFCLSDWWVLMFFYLQVKSQSDGHKQYLVRIRDVDPPTCECPYWRWNHLPCKHMFAIMMHHKLWSELPGHLSTNPYFCLDKEVNNFVCLTRETKTMVDDDDDEFVMDFNNLDSLDECLPSSRIGPKHTVRQTAVLLREKLALLRTNSYLCQDVNALTKTTDIVKEALDFISTKLEIQSGIVLEQEPKQKKRPKASTQAKKTKMKSLKIKRNKPSKRVGVKTREEKYKYGIPSHKEEQFSTEISEDGNTHDDVTTEDQTEYSMHILQKAKGKSILMMSSHINSGITCDKFRQRWTNLGVGTKVLIIWPLKNLKFSTPPRQTKVYNDHS